MAIDWFAEFGAKKPEAPAQETAPAEAEAAETAVEETAAPEQEAENPEEEAAEDGLEASGDGALTKEQRAENAKRRRERERLELEERVRAEARREAEEELNSFIAGMGLSDAEGRPVETREQYEEYARQRDRLLVDEELSRIGMDRGVIDAIINNHPAVAEAKQAAEAARIAERRGLDSSAEARAQEQLAEIQKLDPTIKSMDELRQHESYDRVYSFVKGGLSIADAFKAANLDAIRERDRAAAAQQALNAANSKNHLVPGDAGRGSLSEPVPESVKRSYRQLYGNISDEEIEAKYKRTYKKKG